MRDVDDDIRSSLERLTDPSGSTPPADALWGDLVSRRRRRRARNASLAALPLLLFAVLAVGVVSMGDSDDARTDVAAGGNDSAALDDFPAFEMTYRTLSYQAADLVPSTWELDYESASDWKLTLIEAAPGSSSQPWHRQTFLDGTLTEYAADGTVISEESVEDRVAPMALMSRGPRTGKAEDGNSESAYRHEYRSSQEHECPEDPADGGPYCEQPGETVVVETVEAYNEDGVPVFAEERISGTDRVVWQFEMLTYDRHPGADLGGVPPAGVPSDGADAALGSLYEFRGQDCGDVSAGQPWTIPPAAAECVVAAWRSGRLAHLRITGPTVEGDPVTIAFQVTGQGTYDYISDSRQDAFGAKEVRLWRCQEFFGDPTELQPSFQGAAKCGPENGEELASTEN